MTGADLADLRFADEPAGQRYVARTGDRVAGVIDYSPGAQGTVVFAHTETDPVLRGHGVAGRLTRFALDDLRSRGLRVVPVCSYTRQFLATHPEYADLHA